ncbi:hypothetical protein CWI36_2197p0010, partial [Hamiltosporidium magnivora]
CKQEGVKDKSSKKEGVNDRVGVQEGVNEIIVEQEGVNHYTSNYNPNNSTSNYHPNDNTSNYHPVNNTPNDTNDNTSNYNPNDNTSNYHHVNNTANDTNDKDLLHLYPINNTLLSKDSLITIFKLLIHNILIEDNTSLKERSFLLFKLLLNNNNWLSKYLKPFIIGIGQSCYDYYTFYSYESNSLYFNSGIIIIGRESVMDGKVMLLKGIIGCKGIEKIEEEGDLYRRVIIRVYNEIGGVSMLRGYNNKWLEGDNGIDSKQQGVTNINTKQQGDNNIDKQQGVNGIHTKQQGVNSIDKQQGVNGIHTKQQGDNNIECKQQGVNETTNDQQSVNNSIDKQHPFNNLHYEQHPFNNLHYEQHPVNITTLPDNILSLFTPFNLPVNLILKKINTPLKCTTLEMDSIFIEYIRLTCLTYYNTNDLLLLHRIDWSSSFCELITQLYKLKGVNLLEISYSIYRVILEGKKEGVSNGISFFKVNKDILNSDVFIRGVNYTGSNYRGVSNNIEQGVSNSIEEGVSNNIEEGVSCIEDKYNFYGKVIQFCDLKKVEFIFYEILRNNTLYYNGSVVGDKGIVGGVNGTNNSLNKQEGVNNNHNNKQEGVNNNNNKQEGVNNNNNTKGVNNNTDNTSNIKGVSNKKSNVKNPLNNSTCLEGVNDIFDINNNNNISPFNNSINTILTHFISNNRSYLEDFISFMLEDLNPIQLYPLIDLISIEYLCMLVKPLLRIINGSNIKGISNSSRIEGVSNSSRLEGVNDSSRLEGVNDSSRLEGVNDSS